MLAHRPGRTLDRRATRRVRLRAARRAHRPGARSSPATRPACSSTAARAPPEHRTVADLPDLLADGDLVVVNETKVIPARLRLRRATGGAAEVLLLEPRRATIAARGRRSCARLAGCGRASSCSAPTAGRCSRVGGRTGAGDTFHVELLGDADPLDVARRARRDAAAAVHPRRRWSDPSATRRSTPPSRARPPRRRPACTSPPTCSSASGRRACAVAPVELVVGLDTFQPVSERRPARPPHAQRALPRAGGDVGAPAARPDASWRSARRACGRWRAPRRPARLAGRTELFLHRGVPFRCRRRAADQLPPAAHDAADDDRRLRRPALARRCTPRRSPRATGSCPSATPCSSTATRADVSVASLACTRSRSRSWRPTARPARRSPTRRGAPTARRASCPSAPVER